MPLPTATDPEIRSEYIRGGYYRTGVDLGRCLTDPLMRAVLAIAIKARRKAEARAARCAPMAHIPESP